MVRRSFAQNRFFPESLPTPERSAPLKKILLSIVIITEGIKDPMSKIKIFDIRYYCCLAICVPCVIDKIFILYIIMHGIKVLI